MDLESKISRGLSSLNEIFGICFTSYKFISANGCTNVGIWSLKDRQISYVCVAKFLTQTPGGWHLGTVVEFVESASPVDGW